MIQTRGVVMTKTLCDRCGRTSLASQGAYKYRITLNGKERDLCPICYGLLCKFMHDDRERQRWEGNNARDNQ